MTCSDWINVCQVLATIGIGVVGFRYMRKQNEILERQNEVMSNQADLNERLIEREDLERDKEDTLRALENLHLAAISGRDERLAEYERLLKKGLTPRQLEHYLNQLFPDNNGTAQSTIRTLENLYPSYRAEKKLEAIHREAREKFQK